MREVECKNRWKKGDGREGNIEVQAAPDSAMRFPFRWTHSNLSCDSVHRRYFLSINQIKPVSELRAIALISAFPIVQSPSLLTPIINFLLHAP
jgi:hypothetical protein